MQLFFVPNITTGTSTLPDDEARHVVQVLRKKAGDVLDIVDGQGGWYKGKIVDLSKRSCTVEVSLVKQEEKRSSYKLVMAVSPTKSNDRFEWFLEKATEIGVDEIYPLQCKRTERSRIRLDRYEKVLVSAMKQSLQAWLPKLHPLTTVKEVLSNVESLERKYIGWCDDSIEKVELGNHYDAIEQVCVFIGPEGDFTAEEVEMAREAGCQPVTLGPNRLRTETAALAATHTIALLNQKK